MPSITKRQVLAFLAIYSIVRGVVDEIRPADEMSAESDAYDKTAFDATVKSIDALCGEVHNG